MPYSTPRTDRVFGSAAADQHLARLGGRGGCPDISGTPDAPIRTAVARAGSRNRQTRPDLFVCSRRASIGSASRKAAVARGAPASFSSACATTPSIFHRSSSRTRRVGVPPLLCIAATTLARKASMLVSKGAEMAGPGRDMRVVPRLRLAVGEGRHSYPSPQYCTGLFEGASASGPRPFPSRFSATPGRVQLRQFLVQDDGRRSRPDDPGEAWRQYSLETASLKSEPGQPATLGSPSTPQNRGTLRKRG